MLPYYASLSFIFYFIFITRNVECSDLISRREVKDVRYFDTRRKIFRSTESSDFQNIIYDDASGAIFVGAANFIYMLDASDVRSVIGKVHWAPSDKDAYMCRNFRGDDIVCKNYIRLLHPFNSTTLYACGTMAYRPVCKYININEFKGVQEGGKTEERNFNYLPHEPFSSIVSTMIGGTLFTATSASNGIISRTLNEATLKTNGDLFWLSDPHFVSTFNIPTNEDQGKVYILFREKAEEIPSQFFVRGDDQDDELPKLTYSRIASICMNDHGGRSYVLNKKFTTFTKMRIACPVPIQAEDKQSIPYYYDNLQSSFLVPNAEDPSNSTLYAIFTTPNGASDVTATCVFHMHDIEQALKTNKYWNAAGLHTGKLFSYYDEDAGPPPGSCVKDTTTLSNSRLSFCEKHPLKFGILTPRDASAINQKSGMRFKFIIVDRIPKTESVGGKSVEREYDVVHYITENGYIHREAFAVSNRSMKWSLSPRHVFHNQSSKESIKTVIKSNDNIFVATNASVVQLPLKLCSPSEDCFECESNKDPYCDWTTTDSTHTKRHSEGRHEPGALTGRSNGRENENAEEKRLSELTREIARLNKLVKKQNETIAYLQTDFREVKHNFSLCLRDRTILRGNYSLVTNRIISFEHTKKAATMLYRDTIYALRDCQHKEIEVRKQLHHEKQARNEAEKRRSDDANRVNYTIIDCETKVMDHNSGNGKYVASVEVDDNDSYIITKCEKDKDLLKLQYSEQVKDIKTKLSSSENNHLTDRKHLASCISKSAALRNRAIFLDVMNKNLTRLTRTLRRYREADKRKIQRLQWLHKKNGRRGQQECEYANWFAYKTSNKMFHLGHERMTYSKSIKMCKEIKANLAVFKSEDEMRYVHNVIRSFEFSRHFWIGLVKHHNGTLTWSNGSVYAPGDIERFPLSQRNKLQNRESYCGEITSLQRWQLVPCSKTRRPLCERSYHADIRMNQTQPIIEFEYKDVE